MSTLCWENHLEAKIDLLGGDWNWLIYSSRDVDEVRAKWAASIWPSTHKIGLDRADLRSPHRFKLKSANRNVTNVAWTELDEWLN